MGVNPTAQLLEPEVRELIESGRLAEVRAILHELPLADVADIFEELGPEQAALGFRVLHRDDAGEVFSYLSAVKQEELIDRLGAEGALRVVEAMSPDDRVRLLDELPSEVAQRLVASLSPENRRTTQAILGYPPESVGRLMTPDYVKIRPEWTVQQAIEHLRQHGRDAETINVVYVVDDQGRLIDDMRLRKLLLANPTDLVESIMNHQFVSLRADQDQEEAVRVMSRYDRIALPVVDSRGVLVGIVTSDDVADVAEAEVTEDIQKQGAVQALDAPYMEVRLWEMLRKRGVWLSALFVGQTITIIVLGSYQAELARAAVLMIFLPLVISCGGNSGSQAATLITRALALQEVGPGDWWRIIRREVVTALLLGLSLGFLGWVCVEFFTGIGHAKTDQSLRLAFTVSAAIVAVVLWGTLLGSLLPLLLKRLKIDPATASSPMVATLMDASGTLIYLAVAVLILADVLG